MYATPTIKRSSVAKSNRSPANAPSRQRGGIVAALTKLAVNRPRRYDWKSDYAKALEDKHASVR